MSITSVAVRLFRAQYTRTCICQCMRTCACDCRWLVMLLSLCPLRFACVRCCCVCGYFRGMETNTALCVRACACACADVVFALQQYWFATHNTTWLRDTAWDLISGMWILSSMFGFDFTSSFFMFGIGFTSSCSFRIISSYCFYACRCWRVLGEQGAGRSGRRQQRHCIRHRRGGAAGRERGRSQQLRLHQRRCGLFAPLCRACC